MVLPPIYTYTTADPAAPARRRCVASTGHSSRGRRWVTFGATEDEARAKFIAMWERLEREPEPPAGAQPEEAGDPGDVI